MGDSVMANKFSILDLTQNSNASRQTRSMFLAGATIFTFAKAIEFY